MACLDYFGKDASDLKKKRLFLFDMDGTIYEGQRVFPGTIPLLEYIRRQGGRAMFITNNSSRSVRDYVARLDGMGIAAQETDFYTSSQAAAELLNREHPGKTVFCVGTDSLVNELREKGVHVITTYAEDVSVVLIGYDTQLRYEKLWDACRLLQKDVVYLATNPDWVCPTEFGSVPDCGSICKMLEYATGKWPHFIGKPEPDMIHAACRETGISEKDTVVLGDRLYTDIAAGRNAGVDTICVLSGETTAAEILKSINPPTYTFYNVAELLQRISAA